MVRLFIENNEIELSNDIQFAITKQFEDTSNPTVIINDWSKEINIPFTTKNNDIFGHIYNPDKLTVYQNSVTNLLSATPTLNGVWNGTGYTPSATATRERMSITAKTETIRIALVNQNTSTIIKQETYTNFGKQKYSFTKTPDMYYLEVGFIDATSSASFGGLVAYFGYDIHTLTNGVTYDLNFVYDKVSGSYVVKNSELIRRVPSAGLLDNCNYTIREQGLSGTFNHEEQKITINSISGYNQGSGLYLALYAPSNFYTAKISNLGTGNTGDIIVAGYIPKLADSSYNWHTLELYYQGVNNGESTHYRVTYDISNLPLGNYYLTWNNKYFEHANGKIAAEVSNLLLTDYANVYWGDVNTVVPEKLTGVYFNPLKKLNFRLEYNENILMTGYAKMIEVTQKDGKGSYVIRLNGELGKVFGEMQKITFDKTASDTNYVIDGSKYVDEEIRKELINSSWNSQGQGTPDLFKKGANQYNVNDIIGFAPNNAYSNDFDYKSSEKNGEINKFTDILGSNFTEDTGVDAETVIPNGMTPRGIGEYRSYMQLPYIYFNKLFKVFQEKTEEITDYHFELDKDWFSTSNPYWYKLVYMLKPFDTSNGEAHNNEYQFNVVGYSWYPSQTSNWTVNHTNSLSVITGGTVEQESIIHGNTFTLPADADYTAFKLNYKLILQTVSNNRIQMKTDNALCVHVKATGANGASKTVKFLFGRGFSGDKTGYTYIELEEDVTHVGAKCLSALFMPCFALTRNNFGNSVSFSVQYKWFKNDYPYQGTTETYINMRLLCEVNTTLGISQIMNVNIMRNSFHSHARFTLNDLWNKEYNLFNEIIKYCKMYRIGVFIDDFNKKIKFIPYKTYFQNYQVLDWTDKVDKSKDYVIKPITFDTKYVIFNYKDNDNKLSKEYKEKYGVNYGDYKLTTEYNFNNNKTDLFDGITQSIVNTDNVLSWSNLYRRHKITYSVPAEIMVYNRDKDGKQVDIFGAYFFHNGRATFDTDSSLYMRNVYISDDTDYQICNSTYTYIDTPNTVQPLINTEYYPKLDVVYENNLALFNVPMLNYTYQGDSYSEKNTIYSLYWKNYIDERYNAQNKIVTCYVYLKPFDYINFEYNHFVKIDNQLYFVNKINDYDVTSTNTTKVELITIQKISGYTD